MFERDSETSLSRTTPTRTPPVEPDKHPIAAQLMALQASAGNSSVAALLQRQVDPENEEASPVRELMNSGGGRPLDQPVRQFMESRLGADFGDVRIHTGAQASEAARSVQAHAYTAGTDLVFQDGKYDPGSSEGQRMLAHELTHVVQQRQGPVDGTPAPGGLSISDPSDRFEQAAEASAERAMAGVQTASQLQAPSAGLQRQADDQEADLQMSALQRQEAGDEEEELQMSGLQRQEEEELEDEEL